jgi:hypothetical protein
MLLSLEKAGLISRELGRARSVSVLVDYDLLPGFIRLKIKRSKPL